MYTSKDICVIIGASHAGVNTAFNLRKEKWQGRIILIDVDPELPYHRPPLSKTYLTDNASVKNLLKPVESYKKENIELLLGKKVIHLNESVKQLVLDDTTKINYTKLVLATGAKPIVPSITGLQNCKAYFCLRTAEDVANIKEAYNASKNKRVVIIGGGYIGLETAASLQKIGAEVVVLERESRILKRVATSVISNFFRDLHTHNGVQIFENKEVNKIENEADVTKVYSTDGSCYKADILILGVGVVPNTDLAKMANLDLKNGICVSNTGVTSNTSIYAVGDCSYHYNPHYKTYIRLESVQNAVDQSKVVAASIAGKEYVYDTIPWFWSDQYNIKLQIVGLANNYTDSIIREEQNKENVISVWYFKNDELLAVNAINNTKAYVLGTKFIKEGKKIDKEKLAKASIPLSKDLALAF
ncbi:MAG: FAD-dependent oxidoreductase [Cellulophaga sp.]|uniref:NAD(P)/FAD-dependent oxidoreductase n=1 Tax=Cellulophaga sp. TaxID=1972202 RepID=UPI0032634E62